MLVEPSNSPEVAALDVATVFPAVVWVTLRDVSDGVVGVDNAKLDVDINDNDEDDDIDFVEGNDKDVDTLAIKQNCCAKDSAVPISWLQDTWVQFTIDLVKRELAEKHQKKRWFEKVKYTYVLQ